MIERLKDAEKRYVELEEGMEHQFVPPLKMRFTYKGFWGSTCNFFSYARGNNGNAYGHVERGTTYYGGFVGGICWNCHSFCKLQAMGAGVMPEEGTLNADGTVNIPEVLRPYMGGKEKLVPVNK